MTSLNEGTPLETLGESNAARFVVYGTPESGGGGKEEARGQSYFRGDK